jgi:hypothetical protein
MMLTESDTTRLWGKLFHGQAITSRLLAEAEQLVSELPSESPLRLRFATEINELRDRDSPSRSKRGC